MTNAVEAPINPKIISGFRATSRIWVLLVWWYFALLLVAVFWKYVNTGWGDYAAGLSGPAQSIGSRIENVSILASRIFGIYRADIIQTFFIVVGLAIIGHLIARIRLAVIAWVSVSLAAIVAFIEWIALHQTGMPLTYANAQISFNWAREHPDVIPTVFPWAGIALLVLVSVSYGAIPVVLSSVLNRRRKGVTASYAVGAFAVCILVASVASGGSIFPTWSQSLTPVEGFWSASIASLTNIDAESPVNLPVLGRDSLTHMYDRIAYPLGDGSSAGELVAHLYPKHRRHVVLIVLETAPRRYYRLLDDSTYSTFHKMSATAVVTRHHYTSRPATLFAIYSMLTGTYPRPGTPIGEYGRFHDDGMATVLDSNGYESTYIDSYLVDWGYHYRAELEQQGFSSILDTAGFRAPPGAGSYRAAVARERWSFAQALKQIGKAELERKKAFVVVATTLGHFPWRAAPGMANASSGEKMHAMAIQLDSAVGTFLHGLDSLHLRDSVLVVVTGDHGLRYTAEFKSFGYADRPANVEFNVPFMLYAPGLIKSQISLPYATSHIDIAPTIYYLLGIPADSLVLDGENMLDSRLAERATFLMNTGIYPADGFELRGHYFGWNVVTNHYAVVPPLSRAEQQGFDWSNVRTRTVLTAANHVFNLTAAYFLERAH